MEYWKDISRAIEYIDNNIQSALTAENIANVAGYSVYHFSRIFKAEIGMSIMDYVRRRKMIYALLDSDEKNMLGIAMDYGFETQTGFIKAFKRIYGYTPKNYITKVLSGSNDNLIITYKKLGEKNNVKIENVSHNNIERLLVLADKAYNLTKNKEGKYSYKFWKEKFLVHPELMIYAQDKDNIIGFMFGWVDNDAVTLAYDWVEEKYKNTELKSEMLSSFESQVKSIGQDAIYLGVSSADEIFYETNGYSGRLLVQSVTYSIAELESIALNKCVCTNVYDGKVNQAYFNVNIENKRELLSKIANRFPKSNTIMVYGKKLS